MTDLTVQQFQHLTGDRGEGGLGLVCPKNMFFYHFLCLVIFLQPCCWLLSKIDSLNNLVK